MLLLGLPCGSVGKESACNAGDLGSIPGLGRSRGEGKGYPLQYSGLENFMDCIVHGVTKSRTRLSDYHFASFQCFFFKCFSTYWNQNFLHENEILVQVEEKAFESVRIVKSLLPGNIKMYTSFTDALHGRKEKKI